jgi:hypothetical protein
MNVSALEAGFRTASVEGEGTSGPCNKLQNIRIGFVRDAGEIGKPLAVLLTVAAMSIPDKNLDH